MNDVINIFKELQATSSKNDKIKILKANTDNEKFKSCLKYLFDTNFVTGISTSKINKVVSPQRQVVVLSKWEGVVNYLVENNTGTDVDILVLQNFINSRPEEDRPYIKDLITKSLRLGIDTTTVNKVMPKLIPTWEVQLGSGQDSLKLAKGERFFLSRKLNGNRCSYLDGKLYSRQGKEFTGFQYIIDAIESAIGDKYFVDGELIRDNIDGLSDGENFRIGTGIINSDAEDKSGLKLVIFDVMPREEFINNKKSKDTYSVRKSSLIQLESIISKLDLKCLEVVEMLYEGTDTTKIDECLEYAEQEGWEGCMLNKDKPYVCKRTTDLIKIKKFHTVDLKVIDIVPGEGRLADTLGALVVKYKDNTVNVGSGFSDSLRKKVWGNKEEYIGKIVEVKYKDITKDKTTGKESLQFPVFVTFREDKDTESYN